MRLAWLAESVADRFGYYRWYPSAKWEDKVGLRPEFVSKILDQAEDWDLVIRELED